MARPLSPTRAVIFDLDDTLFRERDYVRSGFAAVGQYLRRRLGRQTDFEEWMWRSFLAGRREGVFDALGRRFRLGLTPAMIAQLVQVYRGHYPQIRPCRGVSQLLTRLRRGGIRLGLLSDGYLPAQQLKLDALELERHFQAVVFTEELGRRDWKPATSGFELIRRSLCIPHDGCAYVADNPAKDFVGPNHLGWLTVQWRRPGQLHADNPPPAGGAPDRIVRSGPQLLALIFQGKGRSRGKS